MEAVGPEGHVCVYARVFVDVWMCACMSQELAVCTGTVCSLVHLCLRLGGCPGGHVCVCCFERAWP